MVCLSRANICAQGGERSASPDGSCGCLTVPCAGMQAWVLASRAPSSPMAAVWPSMPSYRRHSCRRLPRRSYDAL